MYFKLISIVDKILRSNYKIRFLYFQPFLAKIHFFLGLKSKEFTIKGPIFFLEIGKYGYQKIKI
jgi:hypothetical protein